MVKHSATIQYATEAQNLDRALRNKTRTHSNYELTPKTIHGMRAWNALLIRYLHIYCSMRAPLPCINTETNNSADYDVDIGGPV